MFKFVVTKNVKELFHRAVIQNDVARVKLLLEQASQDPKFHVDTLNDEGLTALQLSCFAGNIELVQLLVEHQANVRIKDCHGWTLLHGAALGGKLDIARFLIEKGCRCSSKNDNGEQPIDLASDLAMIVLLLKTMLEQGQNLAVQKYILRHPKLKEELAREIQMAFELDHHQEHLNDTRQHRNRTHHNRKLPASKSAGHLVVNGTRLKIENNLENSQNRHNEKNRSVRPRLVRSTSTGDLSNMDDFLNDVEGTDNQFNKHDEHLNRISGTSYSYSHYTSDSGHNESRSRRKGRNSTQRQDDKFEGDGSRQRKKSDSAILDRQVGRRESDLSSVSSRSEASDSQRMRRSNPAYASVDSTSRRSRSGDSDSSSQSDTGVNRQRRRHKQKTIYESDSKPLQTLPVPESHYETISDLNHRHHKGYDNHRDRRDYTGRYGSRSPNNDDRKVSTASEHSSNYDHNDAADGETEALYENIPNDVLLSIILTNRLSDAARHQSISSNTEALAVEPPAESGILTDVFPEDVTKPIHAQDDHYDDIVCVNKAQDEKWQDEPLYENLKHYNQPNHDNVFHDRVFHDNVEPKYTVDDDEGNLEFSNQFYRDTGYEQELNIDDTSENLTIDHGLVAVPEDFADHNSNEEYILNEEPENVSPIYENLPCLIGRSDETKDTNDNDVLQTHISKQLSKRGVHSSSVGSLPNSYYRTEEQTPVKFHDDTHIGSSSHGYSELPDHGSQSSFRVFQLVKVEYPEVFV